MEKKTKRIRVELFTTNEFMVEKKKKTHTDMQMNVKTHL